VFGSHRNTVSNNTASGDSTGNIWIDYYSSNNTIEFNSLSGNGFSGLYLFNYANNNTIRRNNIFNNFRGIRVIGASNNIIYLNNLYSNSTNVDSDSTNTWNSPTTLSYEYSATTYENYLGNYWHDYGGTDGDSDGIGDTPYSSTDVNDDNYPLAMPFENYEVSEPTKDWTFMVYMAADNNLDPAAIDDLNEMEVAGSTDNISIVALLDRYGDNNTNIYYVTSDNDTDNVTSPIVSGPFGTEVNMGDNSTLVTFVDWTITNYPANHYALVLWDHGSGWRNQATSDPLTKGVCYDDTSAGDRLTTPELGDALAQIQTDTGITLDLVGFDACLMQMAEVAYQIKDYALVMVGSEEVEPFDGWPYDTILGYLTSTPDPGILALANAIVTCYINSYPDASSTDIVTQSAVDLTQVGTLATAVDEFAVAMIASGYADAIWGAKLYSEAFADADFLDLFDFADMVSSFFPASSNVSLKAEAVKTSANSTVVAEAHHSAHPYVHGISIYVPYATYEADYDSLAFAADTQWDEFLNWMLTNGGTEPPWTEIISDGTGEATPDIQGVDACLYPHEDMVLFRVRSNGALNFADLWGLTLLDTDSDNTTGYDGSFGWLSQNDIGADYLVDVYTPGGMAPKGIHRPQREERQTLYADLYYWDTDNFSWVTEVFSFTDSDYYWFGIFLSDMGCQIVQRSLR